MFRQEALHAAKFVLSPVLSLGVLVTSTAWANDDIMDLSLSDVLNIKSTIATRRELTRQESPGILSIVTRKEIADAGLRDLREVLSVFVPGVHFATDVEGQVGIAMRGLWGHEGKILLMVDGLQVNDDIYGTTVFGNHYPAEIIERVEVIRGPGSVIHGGNALIGVVNVVTRVPEKGVVASVRYSQMSDTFSHRNATVAAGGEVEGFKYRALITAGEGQRSQDTYTDTDLVSVNMKGHDLNPKIANLGLSYKGVEFVGIIDRYDTRHLHLGSVLPAPGRDPYLETFETRRMELRYRGELSENLTITPRLYFHQTRPWRIIEPGEFVFTKYSDRSGASISADWSISSNVSLLAGVEKSMLKIRIDEPDVDDPFSVYLTGINEEFAVAFAELSWKTDLGSVVIGGRYEQPKNYQSAFVPRLGLTKALEAWNYKLMLSQSYKVPAGFTPDLVQNATDHLKPEIATNIEAEVGYKFSDSMYTSLNIFDVRIAEPVVFQTVPGNPNGFYTNDGKLGSQGAEFEFRYAARPVTVIANAAYYLRTNAVDDRYAVPGKSEAYVAMPNLRANMMIGYNFTPDFGVFPSLLYYGVRHGYVGAGGDTTTLQEFSPTLLVNLNARYQNLGIKGLDLSLGVMNLTDQKMITLQAHDGGFAGLPDLARAINAGLSYTASF